MTITALTGEGEISNLIVPNGTPGYEISEPMEKLGWRASDTRELSFKDAHVPEGNLLGERGKGFHQFLEILDGGRISVAAMGVGLAQGAYDLAFKYAQEREQFGKPIASFQAIQFQLADMAVEIEAGRNLVYKAAWLKDEGRAFAKEAAMAKLYTGELSHRVVNQALQIHGGYGFMDESAISRLYRDQKILEIGEGTNEVQRMVIASHLGCSSESPTAAQLCRLVCRRSDRTARATEAATFGSSDPGTTPLGGVRAIRAMKRRNGLRRRDDDRHADRARSGS